MDGKTDIKYEWNFGSYAYSDENLIYQCAELYSNHYGTWSRFDAMRQGKNIKLSPNRLRIWLQDENSAIYLARANGNLVGYAIALRIKAPTYGVISWVTQLVVHTDYRQMDIAKNLLLSIWGFSDDFAWGIISANPYAIRALEKATRRRSDPKRIKHNIRKILSIGIEHVPYMPADIKSFVTAEASKINTCFFVDHSDLETMIKNVTSEEVPWKLGELDEGWEWLAFTFHDQLPIDLTDFEITKMLEASDRVVHMAYVRMDVSDNHLWAKHTSDEVKFIMDECHLSPGDTVIDFGCGTGRHALMLAQHEINVQAIDYVDKHIENAQRRQHELLLNNVSFIVDDCRTAKLQKVKSVLCLYDVIGSFADNNENIKIINNISEHLEQGGIAIISVMNYEMTLDQAIHSFSLNTDPNRLLSLKPSNTMEMTGNVFNPNYYLVDTDTHVIYRREQFQRGKALPVELIVRDRRFTRDEIIQMCNDAGLRVEFARCVSARDWKNELDPKSKYAKEILIKCIKT